MSNRIDVLQQPVDKFGIPIPLALPAGVTLARTYDETISTSTEITLNTKATVLIFTAITKMVFLKWGADDVTSSNYDEDIPANQTRVIPIPAGTTKINIIESSATGFASILEK